MILNTPLLRYRPTLTTKADKTVAVNLSVSPVTIPSRVEPLNHDLAQRVYGVDFVVTHRAFVAGTADVVEDDRIKIASGPFAGRYKVTKALKPIRSSPNARMEVGLIDTPESF